MRPRFIQTVHAAAVRLAASLALVLSLAALAPAQEASTEPQSDLALRQGRIADKYARLEQLMLKMAEVDAASNPQRAALLKKAVQQSKDNLTRTQLETLVKLIDQRQLKRAVDGQTEATTEMKALLELLQSENRADRLKDEQERIKEYIQEVERLLRLHKDVQGRTEGSDKTENVARDQAKVADRTGNLARKIQENEEGGDQQESSSKPEDKPAENKPHDEGAKPSDEKPSDEKPADPSGEKPADPSGEKPEGDAPEQKPADGQPQDGNQPSSPMDGEPMDGQQGQPMPGQQGQPMEGQPGQPGQSQQQDQQQQQQQEENPARQRLQQAEQRMRQAQKKLEEAQRNEAREAQELARQELEKAKAELEKILRQLREEEIGRTLAQLESRFRKMLEMQLRVYEATQRLASIPAEARGREVDIESGKQAVEERKIVLEADKAYQLLLEEGSSIAFPESVEQMRLDMETVAQRLSRTQLDAITLGAEEDIIAALNELIAALQQAQKDQEEKQQQEQQQQQQPGDPQEQPLVDRIAELKMIKSLQLRVNNRTQRMAKLLEEPDDAVGQATDADLLDAIEKLGDRQERLHQITRDIVLGRNQ